MTLKEIKDYLKEEVELQRDLNCGKIHRGFVREIKEMTVEALHQEDKITDKQYIKLMKEML